jgi:glutaconate CoA-transferase subunit A
VIASVDRIVPTAEVVAAGVTIPEHLVDAVVEVPFGAHPAACYPNYSYDRSHLSSYVAAAQAGGEELAGYLKTFVFGASEPEYREIVGDLERLTAWSSSVDGWKELFR